MEKLKPCPFCGAELEYEEHIAIKVAGHPLLRLWAHPSGSCILAGLEVPQDDHEAWNRRILCRRNRQNPTADVVPVVRGKWIGNKRHQSCSECHMTYCVPDGQDGELDMTAYHFCPNCGAMMEGE